MRPLLPILLACGLAAGAAVARPSSESAAYDWGFLASRHPDLHGVWHTKAAGPFFEAVATTNGPTLEAWRPFYATAEHPALGRANQEYLWPIAQSRKIGDQSVWRCLVFMGFNHDLTTNQPRQRTWILPFYFSGRDSTGATYHAVFPFGGNIHEFLGRDAIHFVLFPLYSTSRLNDLRTRNWLWPFISVTHGEGTYRFRVLPFYAHSVRAGQYDKKFYLWPFWSQVRYDDPHHPGGGFMLWPLYGQMKVPGQVTRWYLPPFFKFAHAPKMDVVHAPWPFVQYARSKVPGQPLGPLFGRTNEAELAKLYLWPFWGRKQVGIVDRSFALWPFVWWQTAARADRVQHRFQIAPLLFAQREVSTSNQQVVARYHRVWPLYSYRREGPESRFRTLELWPFAQNGAVERNWAPLWTLYSRHRLDDQVDTEVLWGLYRDLNRGPASRHVSLFPFYEQTRRAEGPRASWSVLKGLVGRERVGSHVRWRLLYFLTFGCIPEDEP